MAPWDAVERHHPSVELASNAKRLGHPDCEDEGNSRRKTISKLPQGHSPQGEELNPAEQPQTPLEKAKAIRQQQAHNSEAKQAQGDGTSGVPGAGPPSDRRHHPQRQMYGGPEARD